MNRLPKWEVRFGIATLHLANSDVTVRDSDGCEVELAREQAALRRKGFAKKGNACVPERSCVLHTESAEVKSPFATVLLEAGRIL